jgi:hypothetical protein
MKMRSAFVRNESKEAAIVTANKLQKFTFNFSAQTSRLETLEDRPYTVIPMVMLVEGVHAGSDGPLYYPKDELGKTPAVWNHKPIVVYHPEQNGQGISACDPVVINTRKVGLIMNTKFVGSRLTAEAWIENARADKVDKRVMEAVTKNEMMELSTGVFVDIEPAEGEWQKEEYVGIARNYRADHLALLPDMIGACSVSDGAGFIRNQKKGKKPNPSEILKNAVDWISRRWGITGNEMSMDNIRCALSQALQSRFAPGENGPYIWVADVYSNFVVYENDNTLYQLGYTASDSGVTLSEGAPTEVNRVTEYRTVSGTFVGNRDQPKTEDTTMDKTKMILAILAAGAASGWSETDRPKLDSLTDNQVKCIHDSVVKPPTTNNPPPAPTVDPKKVLVDAIIANNQYGWGEVDRAALMTMNEQQLGKIKLTAPAPAPATNTPANVVMPKFTNVDEFIAFAPPGMQEVLRNGVDSAAQEKLRLIGVITKNANNPFTPEQLGAMSLTQLRQTAQLAGGTLNSQPDLAPPGITPMYWGQAPVTDNATPANQEALPLPALDFTTK